MTTEPGLVEIRRDGAGFAVVLAPPDPAFPDQRFEDLRAAYGFSGGVRMVTGRKRVDLTGLER